MSLLIHPRDLRWIAFEERTPAFKKLVELKDSELSAVIFTAVVPVFNVWLILTIDGKKCSNVTRAVNHKNVWRHK